MKLNHTIASFVIMATLIVLSLTIYNGVKDSYGFEEQFVDDSGDNIMDALNNLHVISSLNQTVSDPSNGRCIPLFPRIYLGYSLDSPL